MRVCSAQSIGSGNDTWSRSRLSPRGLSRKQVFVHLQGQFDLAPLIELRDCFTSTGSPHALSHVCVRDYLTDCASETLRIAHWDEYPRLAMINNLSYTTDVRSHYR
jgi:hypothetical protein